MSVAVIQFPGSNCENETCDALESNQIQYTLVPWNTDESLDRFDGFILPGGFSFQDRIRAGVIAAKLPILDKIKQQSEVYQKPILGICNGAQILVESGLFSDQNDIIDFNYIDHQMVGFICDWGFLTPFNSKDNLFLKSLSDNDVLPIQICHGEGRFILNYSPKSGMKYTSIDGKSTSDFPITPNGAEQGIAAISNTNGNALAIMPHPERSLDSKCYPLSIRAYAKKHNLNLIDFKSLFRAFEVQK
ncbi:MAG: phosphoribosylformylglycinamidine synthase subunit PurQ [Candidatus Margulisiibacteriota bacterium]